jgi:hypothetical protein
MAALQKIQSTFNDINFISEVGINANGKFTPH